MGRPDSSLGGAHGSASLPVPKAAVLAGSVLLGVILVWVLVRLLAPHVDGAVLFSAPVLLVAVINWLMAGGQADAGLF